MSESTVDLKRLSFNSESVSLNPGESTIVECNTTPSNIDTKSLMWETNNDTLIFLNPSKVDGRRCKITASANHYGKGSVRCYDKVTGIGAICNIEVAAVRNTALPVIRWLVFFAVIAFLFILSKCG